jgi:anti-anti-sigma factor
VSETNHDNDHDNEAVQMSASMVDDHLVVRLWGALDVAGRARACSFLDAEIDAATQRVVLDLSGLRFADSDGLAILFHALRRVDASSGTVVLRSPPPNLRQSLRIMGLDEIFPVEDPTLPLRTAPWAIDPPARERSIRRPTLGSARHGGRAPTG